MAAMTRARLLASLALLAALTDAVPSVTNLHSTSQTLNTVTLAWDLDPPSPQPTVYTLMVDGLISQFYPGADNTHTATDLQPCQTYHFELKPTYEDGDGLSDETTATTEYMTPEGTSDLSYDEASNTLTWTEPSNAMCVDHYSVCWRSQMTAETSCVETSEPSLPLDMVSGCEEVNVMVKPVAPNGKEGPEESLEFATAYGDPGAPVNFTVKPLPGFAAALFWDLPEENPACIADQVIDRATVDGKESYQYSIATTLNPQLRSDEEALEANLTACTDYVFKLYFVSVEGVESDVAEDTLTTDYLPPGEIEELTFTTDETSMKVSWNDSLLGMNCLDHLKICYDDTFTHEAKCIDAENPGVDKSVTIDGLSPCRHYTVVVTSVSITGEIGPATAHDVKMNDTAPGPVTNLVVDEVTTSSILVSFDPPTERPECAVNYVVSHKQWFSDLTSTPKGATKPASSPRAGSLQHHVEGLYSCSQYRIEVYAVSASEQAGLREPVWERTMDEAPSAPSDLTTQTKSSSSITTSWFAPANRFCVSWYKIRADTETLEGEEVTLPEESDSMERMHTLTDLQACKPHTVVVEAGNDFGSSVASYVESTVCE